MRTLILSGLVAALWLCAATSRAAVRRTLDVEEPGRATVTLDRDVYEHARADLGDLRIIDDAGRAVPYLLDRATGLEPFPPRRPAVGNLGFARGRSVQATLDFGSPTLKSELTLVLSGDNFRRRVIVEGRNRFEPAWTTLTDSAYMFAVPPPVAARYETVPLPENNFPLLRVTVEHGPDDPERIEILDASTRPAPHRRPREEPLAPRLTRAQDPASRETVLTLDLGARHRPFRGIVLDVADAAFFRGVVVEARVDASPPPRSAQRSDLDSAPPPLAWRYLGEGAVYRYEADGAVREGRRLEIAGRERVLRLRIRNRDDAPLAVRGVTVLTPVERLAFHARAGRRYVLRYGDPESTSPAYDMASTAGDPVLWAVGAMEARLGAAEAVTPPPPLPAPWTERHPALIWGGLVAVVAGLGAVTWHALKSAA